MTLKQEKVQWWKGGRESIIYLLAISVLSQCHKAIDQEMQKEDEKQRIAILSWTVWLVKISFSCSPHPDNC